MKLPHWSNVAIFSTFGAVNALLLFLNNVMLTRMLSKTSYGEIGIATSYMIVVMALVAANALGLVGIRRSQLDDTQFARFNTAYISTLQLCTLLLVILLWLFSTFSHGIGWLTLIIPAYAYFVSLNDYHSAIMVQKANAICFGVAAFISRSVALVAIYIFIRLGRGGVEAYFLGLAGGEAVSTLYRRRTHELFGVWLFARPKLSIGAEERGIIQYGMSLVPLLFLGWASNGVDRLVIGSKIGLEAVAVYSFGMVMAQSINVVNSAVTNTVTARIYTKLSLMAPVKSYVEKCLLAYLVLTSIFLLVFDRFAIGLIHAFIGDRYDKSAGIATVLVFSVLLNGLYRISITVTDYYERVFNKTILNIVSVAITLSLLFMFTTSGGVMAVAWSVAAGNAAMAAGAYYLAMRHIAHAYGPGVA